MLDTKQSWDDLCAATPPTPPPATRSWPTRSTRTSPAVRAEPRLHRHGAALRDPRLGRYDLIVVDTPPTRNAIDFLEAPERMADFFSSAAALAHRPVPVAGVHGGVSKPFYNVADRILGSQFLEDIAEFFMLFQTMYDGFVERADAVSAPLRPRTTFVVVSTLEAAPVREAEFFIDALDERAAATSAPWCSTRCCLAGLVRLGERIWS
jgi:hypothetical protein